MKLTETQKEKLYHCLELTQENKLSPEEISWLNDILIQSEQAQELLLKYMRLSANMQWSYGTVPEDANYPQEKLVSGTPARQELLKPALIKRKKKKQESPAKKSWAAMWVLLPVLLAGFLWGGFFFTFLAKEDVPHHLVARIMNSDEAHWKFGKKTWRIGEQIRSGEELNLDRGIVEIESTSGTRMIIEGPALFVPWDHGIVELKLGSLFAHVPKKAIGFVVKTPTSQIVDLGTKFGVVVSGTGETEVHVIKGRIEAGQLNRSGFVVNARRLTANDAVRIEKNNHRMTEIKVRPENFVQQSRLSDKEPVLVAHWKLNEETGADTAKDASKNQLHLGLIPEIGVSPFTGVVDVTGLSTSAGSFSNQKNRLQRVLSQAEADQFDVACFTIAMWVRNPVYASNKSHPILFHYRNTDVHKVSQFNWYESGFGLLTASDSQYVQYYCPSQLKWEKDRWYHIVLTYDPNTYAPDDSLVTITRTSQDNEEPKFSHTFTAVEDMARLVAGGNLIIGGSSHLELPRHWGGEIGEAKFYSGIPKEFKVTP